MAETDQGRMEKYRSKINSVARQTGIDPALIAGIISRESRAGNALSGGWGDGGRAWGLMQVQTLTVVILTSSQKTLTLQYNDFILFSSHLCRLILRALEADTKHRVPGTVRNTSARPLGSWLISLTVLAVNFHTGAKSFR